MVRRTSRSPFSVFSMLLPLALTACMSGPASPLFDGTDPPDGPATTACAPGLVIVIDAETIDTDTHWDCVEGAYLLQGTVRVKAGATLTVAPGVLVEAASGARMLVGFESPGALIAEGTADAPITFAGAISIATPGHWSGIKIDANATKAVFRFVEILDAGRYDTTGSVASAAALTVIGLADVALTDSVIEYSAHNGLRLRDGAFPTELTRNTFANNAEASIAAEPEGAGSVTAPNAFLSPEDHILVEGGIIEQNTTWHAAGAPFVLKAAVFVEGASDPLLTIKAGVQVHAEKGALLLVGSKSAGALVTEGTAEAPVLFTSRASVPQPGDWSGIIFDANASAQTLRHTMVEFAGRYTTVPSQAMSANVAAIDVPLTMTDGVVSGSSHCSSDGDDLSTVRRALRTVRSSASPPESAARSRAVS